MNFQFKKYLLIIITFLLAQPSQATTRKVLFIGDSYIYVNNMPLILQTLAAALGDTLIYQESDPGGFTFALHSTYAPTISKIFAQQWDVVVLQDQSEEPAFSPSQVDTQVYPYAHKLDSMIHVNDNCTQTLFLMTWGHANGDTPNCPVYPVVCTYGGMQERLRESYLQMTQDNKAIVGPVGVAWKEMRDSFPGIWLYQADSTHPLVTGSYLEACVLYNSIFHKKTMGTTYIAGLSASDAGTIQRIADKVTLDSIKQWQQYGHYPDANFTYVASGRQVAFSPLPTSNTKYLWKYGDGGTDTTTTPTHTYAASGVYIVSHTATTSCFSETITNTVSTYNTGITAVNTNGMYPIKIAQNGNGNITFLFPEEEAYNTLEIFDVSGRLIKKYTVNSHNISDNLVPGFYVYRAYSLQTNSLFYDKLIVR